jgi:hypothetical protein
MDGLPEDPHRGRWVRSGQRIPSTGVSTPHTPEPSADTNGSRASWLTMRRMTIERGRILLRPADTGLDPQFVRVGWLRFGSTTAPTGAGLDEEALPGSRAALPQLARSESRPRRRLGQKRRSRSARARSQTRDCQAPFARTLSPRMHSEGLAAFHVCGLSSCVAILGFSLCDFRSRNAASGLGRSWRIASWKRHLQLLGKLPVLFLLGLSSFIFLIRLSGVLSFCHLFLHLISNRTPTAPTTRRIKLFRTLIVPI